MQYFAAIEPQRRLAPHVHLAIRGTVARAELRRVLAATYHQVWWPDATAVKYDGDELPVWDEAIGGYLDPATGEVLPTWDQALDAIGDEDEPWHVARFGVRFDAQGVLAGSKDAARCIGYLTKYLTKQVADCHQADTDPQRAHAGAAGRGAALPAVLADVRELAPVRHPAQERPARPGPRPRARARPTTPITSATPGAGCWSPASGPARPWPTTAPTGRTGCWRTLGVSATDPARYAWEPVAPADPDHMDHARRLLHAVADRARWQAALNDARRRAGDLRADLSATVREAA